MIDYVVDVNPTILASSSLCFYMYVVKILMYHSILNLEERMRYAWTAYKERWAREEEHLNNLSEQKKVGPEKG